MQVNSLRSFDEICAGFLAAIHHRDALRHEQHARARAGTNNSPEASAAPNDAVQPNATLQVGEPGRGRNRIHREERARRRARRRARDGGQAEPSQADAVFLEGLDGLIREETDRADAQSRDHHPNRGN